MAKKITAQVKLQLKAGKATPAPPVGPALGQHGINMMEFCKQYNAATAERGDLVIPVIVTIYSDRSFSFALKTPPASVLICKELGIPGGSGVPNRNKVGKLTLAQVEKIAQIKMPDLNTDNLASAMLQIEGTARSMGVDIIRD
jgi:large subunit ribosomal protein L11